MFELDCDSQLNNLPLPTLWSLHELNVLAKNNSGNGFLRQTCRTNLLSAIVTFWEHRQLKGWQHQTLCFSAWDRFFPAAATKGWAWCNHNAEVVERAAAIRNLLLAKSGWLKFPKGVAGMDSWRKHVPQISFRKWVTFWEHRQLKGWQPRFQTTEAKSWISTILHWLAAVAYIRQPKSQSNSCSPNLGYHNSIFCKHDATDATIMQSWWSGRSQGPQASGREWMLGISQILFGTASHFSNIGSWKAGSPTSNPPWLIAQSRHISIVDMASGKKNTFQYSVTNLGDHNSVTKPMLFCIWHKSGIFDKGMGSFASIKQA